MRWAGTAVMDVEEIRVADGFEDRLTDPAVIDLAASLRMTDGPIQLPVVHTPSGRLVAGHDRLAATCLNGDESLEVRLVEGSEREMEILTITENLRRRHDDKTALTKRLVDLLEEATPDPPPREGRGRQISRRGAARQQAAELLGVAPGSVAVADSRAAAAERTARPAPPAPPARNGASAFHLQTWGHGVDADDQRDILDVLHQLDLVAKSYTNIQAVVARLERHRSEYGRRLYQRLYRAAHGGADDAKGLRPVAICPLCYQGALMPRCKCCKGAGWVTQLVLDNLPPDMRNGHNAGVDVTEVRIAAEGVVPVDPPPTMGTFDAPEEEELL